MERQGTLTPSDVGSNPAESSTYFHKSIACIWQGHKWKFCQLVKILSNIMRRQRTANIVVVANCLGATLGIAAEILIKEGPCLWVD